MARSRKTQKSAASETATVEVEVPTGAVSAEEMHAARRAREAAEREATRMDRHGQRKPDR